LRKLKTTFSNVESHQRTLQILQEENQKLKNEISSLRSDRGSADFINSYKQQVQTLNDRIHELEQEKSNLKAELLNLRHEYEVKLSVYNLNAQVDIKGSGITRYDNERDSEKRSANLTSPVQKFNIGSNISSPKENEFGIRLVDSKI
jgi:chromosome segregation ATPase